MERTSKSTKRIALGIYALGGLLLVASVACGFGSWWVLGQ